MFRAFDRRSGKVRWQYNIHADGLQTSFHGDPLLTDGLIVITCDNAWRAEGAGHVYAFEVNTGKLRWKHREPIGIPTDVRRVGPNVVAITLADELICLDLATGDLKWRFASGADNDEFHMNASPAVAGDRVYMGTIDGHVYALDGTTGDEIWRRDLGARITMTLIVHGKDLYAGTEADRTFRLDRNTGAVAAELELPATPRSAPAWTDAGLLLFAGRDRLLCVDAELTEIRWQRQSPSRWTSRGVLVRNGAALVGGATGEVAAFAVNDSRPLWSRTFTGIVRSLAADEHALYIGTFEGMLTAIAQERLGPSE